MWWGRASLEERGLSKQPGRDWRRPALTWVSCPSSDPQAQLQALREPQQAPAPIAASFSTLAADGLHMAGWRAVIWVATAQQGRHLGPWMQGVTCRSPVPWVRATMQVAPLVFAGSEVAVQREVPDGMNHHCVCKDKMTLQYLIKVIIDILLLARIPPCCRCFADWG